jgi:hypothetical protein
MMDESDGGSPGADQQTDDDNGNPDGVDNLPDPYDRVVIVHVAPLSVFRLGPGLSE